MVVSLCPSITNRGYNQHVQRKLSITTIHYSKGQIITSMPDLLANIFLVRHGETTANRDGILQGHSDYDLTDRGHQDAITTGTYLSRLHFDYVYSSDLGRAIKTADLILEQNSSTMVGARYTPLIREKYFGVRENLPKHVSVDEARKIVAVKRGIKEEDVLEVEEAMQDLLQRQKAFLQQIKEDIINLDCGYPLKNILCISHGAYIAEFLHNLDFFGDMRGAGSMPHWEGKLRNCCVNVITLSWKDDGSTVSSRPTIGVKIVNFAEHIDRAHRESGTDDDSGHEKCEKYTGQDFIKDFSEIIAPMDD